MWLNLKHTHTLIWNAHLCNQRLVAQNGRGRNYLVKSGSGGCRLPVHERAEHRIWRLPLPLWPPPPHSPAASVVAAAVVLASNAPENTEHILSLNSVHASRIGQPRKPLSLRSTSVIRKAFCTSCCQVRSLESNSVGKVYLEGFYVVAFLSVLMSSAFHRPTPAAVGFLLCHTDYECFPSLYLEIAYLEHAAYKREVVLSVFAPHLIPMKWLEIVKWEMLIWDGQQPSQHLWFISKI